MLTNRTVRFPAVIVAVGVITGWAIANEYLHASFNYAKGILFVEGHIIDDTAFEVAVFMMIAVVFVAATTIIILGTKKKSGQDQHLG